MSTVSIALLQMRAFAGDQQANLSKGEAFCRRARQLGADIALFPEMWNIGYTFYDPEQPGSREGWAAQAVGPEDAFVTHFRALAQELQMAIALTYLERWPGAPRNTVSLIDRHGDIVLTYAKVHTCEWGVESALTPGDAFHVCALDTAQGEVQVGAMICYDREHPESARLLMLQGAELILTPNACELEINRLSQFRARAYENMVAVAMANYAAPDANGHSVAFDGMAYDEQWSRDMLMVEAGPEEGVYLATLDLERLRVYRQHEIWGNAFRRPGRYGLLTSPEVKPPFVRDSATR
ncbi:MAG: carbon-nitrogen hydrolase family protein [Chloroflexi bacterium]|jgi:N-carbamoylputrescine amidase|nr:carbon-nitrogen hydrolase family protein [Chloroflexota bacterium]